MSSFFHLLLFVTSNFSTHTPRCCLSEIIQPHWCPVEVINIEEECIKAVDLKPRKRGTIGPFTAGSLH